MTRNRIQSNFVDDDLDEYSCILLNDLRHENASVRKDTWQSLTRVVHTDPERALRVPRAELNDILLKETDSYVLLCALRTYVLLNMIAPSSLDLRPLCLGEWMWSDFHEKSSVMYVADPERLRRDENAVITLARSLSEAEFSDTKFECIDPGSFAPRLIELDGVRAICFVGRLWLFGKHAVEKWADNDRAFQYRFGAQYRPENLGRGELDPEFHSIWRGDDKVVETSDDDEIRTDYGLVRRYIVTRNRQQIVVVQLAGCSSLGTQAAAYYAAHTLLRPDEDGGLPPTPEAIDGNSHMEALIGVTADINRAQFGWDLGELKLLDLRVGDYVWDIEAKQWKLQQRTVIAVEFPSGDDKLYYRRRYRNATISVNGKLTKFQTGSENHRLCLALMMLAAEHDGIVSLEKLGQERWIWKDGETRTVKQVRSRLTNTTIRGKLKSAYVVEGDTCQVFASITIKIAKSSTNAAKPRRKKKLRRTNKPRQTLNWVQ